MALPSYPPCLPVQCPCSTLTLGLGYKLRQRHAKGRSDCCGNIERAVSLPTFYHSNISRMNTGPLGDLLLSQIQPRPMCAHDSAIKFGK